MLEKENEIVWAEGPKNSHAHSYEKIEQITNLFKHHRSALDSDHALLGMHRVQKLLQLFLNNKLIKWWIYIFS